MRVLDAVRTRARDWRDRLHASDRIRPTGGPYIDPSPTDWYVHTPAEQDDGDETEDPDEPTLTDDIHTTGHRRF
jgi:hypothetical protein